MKSTLIAAAAAALLATTAHAEVATYAIEPTHTFATFEISHFGTSTNRGRFDKKEGTVSIDRAAKTGKLDVTIDTTSINSGTPRFDSHLKSAEILNTEANPTARFVGDKFSFNGDKVTEVAGMLTLAGKTNPVTLKAINFNCYQNPMLKREVCGGDFEATITRSQFGVNYGLNYGFPDAVRLVIQVEAVKQ
ncbi:YceI family protein [Ideonella sp.]|uniref:YceI family protein n=1 Tax=Ideonella sp. TaxID=1929293 RepID=UPI003BB752F7